MHSLQVLCVRLGRGHPKVGKWQLWGFGVSPPRGFGLMVLTLYKSNYRAGAARGFGLMVLRGCVTVYQTDKIHLFYETSHPCMGGYRGPSGGTKVVKKGFRGFAGEVSKVAGFWTHGTHQMRRSKIPLGIWHLGARDCASRVVGILALRCIVYIGDMAQWCMVHTGGFWHQGAGSRAQVRMRRVVLSL